MPPENTLRQLRIVPVIEIADAAHAVPLGQTLVEAGLPVAEVTFRTPAAAEAIARMVREVPGLLVGAGTVLSVTDVDAAVDAGAHFLVSPGLNPAVVASARSAGVPIIPGVTSPTEIEAARSLGLRLLKLFPAEAVGGLPLVKAFAAPYPDVEFMPTGGITASSLESWLQAPNVVACGGSWIATKTDIAERRWDDIRTKASQAVRLASPSVASV
ncbi:bifunctional 4-hydroxy-2-oxoglutarate aldolase/2-dehydro-3-deoxy-phosphogluconate aldolase [Paenarthrobacter sp. AT5]|uniref:bifunctional 4-hydroxy-2-oxoglutarate aldolase/2-dehydro-3-deoxy-phosphogluconate aldolase n=1 Tax=Paenarthrobacter TaxID=1742992 RepID=UPI001A984142|nr:MULTISPECIES: bifunctional 4-hydroxy-2-oxoglutarate aldolase/2-dehydro-3-deoxy-phosphogluconate aldolase [Paenarthrobacter]QSZ52684.1 2-dehydro-3-deoxyphosphogluconate aldolase [Paenarthrobacter ureafaciens]WOC60530.1 bifunctional 4-hydroxy-2-oxoglutarate aldolase/2-dehydro-3-deoxy-phosphogluconate aldolase [Paenarthrobacter sp. AT5]